MAERFLFGRTVTTAQVPAVGVTIDTNAYEGSDVVILLSSPTVGGAPTYNIALTPDTVVGKIVTFFAPDTNVTYLLAATGPVVEAWESVPYGTASYMWIGSAWVPYSGEPSASTPFSPVAVTGGTGWTSAVTVTKISPYTALIEGTFTSTSTTPSGTFGVLPSGYPGNVVFAASMSVNYASPPPSSVIVSNQCSISGLNISTSVPLTGWFVGSNIWTSLIYSIAP